MKFYIGITDTKWYGSEEHGAAKLAHGWPMEGAFINTVDNANAGRRMKSVSFNVGTIQRSASNAK